MELRTSGLDIVILESGGLEFDQATQDLYQGESIGHPGASLDTARLRFFGGSTNHWGGFCRPFDPQDFKVRPWVNYSGWPIDRTDLDPYYAKAHPLVQLQDYDYRPEIWADALPELFATELFTQRLKIALFQLSPPTRMGDFHQNAILNSDQLRVFFWANVKEIRIQASPLKVSHLDVGTLQGNNFEVHPKAVILATGGIENARLLLASNSTISAGIGNQNDLVGRYFMDHPSHDAATVLLHEPSLIARRPAMQPIYPQASLRPEVEEKERLLRFMTTFHVGRELFKEPQSYIALRAILKSLGRMEWPQNFQDQIAAFITDIDGAVGHGYNRYFGKAAELGLRIHPEVEPNPASRVTLSSERDALGMQKAVLNWQLTKLDRHSIRRGLEIVGEEVGRVGLGRLKLHDWVLNPDFEVPGTGSWHHIGTTRMHEQPKFGVVDKNCRVHGLSNLFIAGSSTFATSGMANPTLTVIALALRLADHIKSWRPDAE